MPRPTPITPAPGVPIDDDIAGLSMLMASDVESGYVYSVRHPERVHEIMRLAAAGVEVGSRILSPGSVAVAILQGTVKTASDVSVTANMADKQGVAQAALKRDLYAKALPLAYGALSAHTTAQHRSKLTLQDQIGITNIADRLAIQRNPVKLVAALHAEAVLATPLRLDDMKSAWHTIVHRDLTRWFTLDQWCELACRAMHGLAMLGEPVDEQGAILPRIIRSVLPTSAITDLHRTSLHRWLTAENATTDAAAEPCAVHIRTLPGLFEVIADLHDRHPHTYADIDTGQHRQQANAVAPITAVPRTTRDVPGSRAVRPTTGAFPSLQVPTCHRFNRGECRLTPDVCRFAHTCSHCARAGKQFPHPECECRIKQRSANPGSIPTNDRRPTGRPRPVDRRPGRTDAASVDIIPTDGLDADAIALVQQFASSLQPDTAPVDTEPTQTNMALITPADHLCSSPGCTDDEGTGAHEDQGNIEFFDAMLETTADASFDIDITDLCLPAHTSLIIVDSTMPESLACLVVMHGKRTFSMFDVQKTPFPVDTPLLDCPAAIIASALRLNLTSTGAAWHLPHRMGASSGPVVLSTVTDRTVAVYSRPHAHRWVSAPPQAVRSLIAKLQSIHRDAKVPPPPMRSTTTPPEIPRPRLTAADVCTTIPVTGINRNTASWMPCSYENVLADPDHYCGCDECCFSPQSPYDLTDDHRALVGARAIFQTATTMIHGVIEAVLEPDAQALPEGKPNHGYLLSVIAPSPDLGHRDLDGFEIRYMLPLQSLLIILRGVMAKIPITRFRIREPQIEPGQSRLSAEIGRSGVLSHVYQGVVSMLYEAQRHDDLADVAPPCQPAHVAAVLTAAVSGKICTTDLVDSGASAHFTPFMSDFPHGFTSSETISVQMANGEKIDTVTQKGPVVIRYPSGTLILPEAHYTPSWTRRLLSEVRLLKTGYKITGDTTNLRLETPAGAKIPLGTQNNVKEITRMPTIPPTPSASAPHPLMQPISPRDPILKFAAAYMAIGWGYAATQSVSRTLTQWHHTFGCMSRRPLLRLLHQQGYHIQVDGVDEIDCQWCRLSKSTRVNTPKTLPASRAPKAGEEWQADVWSLPLLYSTYYKQAAPKSRFKSGWCYVHVIVDKATRYCVCYLSKNKEASTLAAHFMRWHAYLKHKHPTIKVKSLHTDADPSYLSEELFINPVSALGISVRSSPKLTHESSGTVERAQRYLAESAIAMILGSRLGKPFLPFAMLYAAQIRNCYPQKDREHRSAHVQLFSSHPDLTRFHPFGATAIANRDPAVRKKGEPRGKNVQYIGIDSKTDSHLFYDKATDAISSARDVNFQDTDHDHDLVGDLIPPPTPNFTTDAQMPPVDPTPDRSSAPDVPGAVVHPSTEINVDELYPDIGETAPSLDPDHNTSPGGPEPAHTHECEHCETFSGDLDTVLDHEKTCPMSQPRARRGRPLAAVMFRAMCTAIHVSTMLNDDTADASAASATTSTHESSGQQPAPDPTRWSEAMVGPDREEWITARQNEIKNMTDVKCMTLVPMRKVPRNTHFIPTQWITQQKRSPVDRSIKTRKKIRLCALGFRQRKYYDFSPDSISAPVAATQSTRVAAAIAAHYNIPILTFDVQNAFQAHAPLEEELYIRPPDGFPQTMPDGSPAAMRLNNALQGLKQSGAVFYEQYALAFERCNMHRTVMDPCVLVPNDPDVVGIVVLHADDALVVIQDGPLKDKIIASLELQFGPKTCEACTAFIGIQISQCLITRTVKLHLTAYLRSVISKHHMMDCHTVGTPITSGEVFARSTDTPPKPNDEYSQIVGALAYASTACRIDLAGPVALLARHMSNPTDQCLLAAKRLLRWVKGNATLGLTYGPTDYCHPATPDESPTAVPSSKDLTLVAYCDADFATSDPEKRRSVTGYAIKLGTAAVCWLSKLQPLTASSTSSAEYIALHQCTQAVLQLRHLLKEAHFPQIGPTVIYEDSSSCMTWAMTKIIKSASKHLAVRWHSTRQEVGTTIIPTGVPTYGQAADFLTKPLPRPTLLRHLTVLGMFHPYGIGTTSTDNIYDDAFTP